MFGPDRCGSDSKLHFIFRHVNPKNKTIEEKHCKKLDTKERAVFEELFKDNRPHLFRLVINPDNSFEISVDYKVTFKYYNISALGFNSLRSLICSKDYKELNFTLYSW